MCIIWLVACANLLTRAVVFTRHRNYPASFWTRSILSMPPSLACLYAPTRTSYYGML